MMEVYIAKLQYVSFKMDPLLSVHHLTYLHYIFRPLLITAPPCLQIPF